jgi:hypothetical protein
LNLEDKKLLKKITNLRDNLFLEDEKIGSITDDWIDEIITLIRMRRKNVISELIKLCYDLLGMYDLPISQSNEMLTKVLDEFNGLNIGF